MSTPPWHGMGDSGRTFRRGGPAGAVHEGSVDQRHRLSARSGERPGFRARFRRSRMASARSTGNDIGYGFNLGVLYEPWAGTRVGAAYRSAIDQTLHGDGNFGSDNAGCGPGAERRRLVSGRRHQRQRDDAGDGIVRRPSPVVARVGGDGRGGVDALEPVQGSDDQVRQRRRNRTASTDDDWEDTWFFALGATWRPTEMWTLRGGGAFDQDPIPESRRTPRIPADDRDPPSFGAGYQPCANLAIDFGYTHVFMKNASVDLSASQRRNQRQLRGTRRRRSRHSGFADTLGVPARPIQGNCGSRLAHEA